MPLTHSPALLPHLPSLHTLSLTADQYSPTSQLLFPNGPSEVSITHLVKQDERDMRDLGSKGRRVVVWDDDGKGEGEGEVVSYALWEFFVGKKGEDEEGGGEGEKKEGGGGDGGASWPPDANGEALGALVEMGRRKREGIMRGRDYAFLASLCTAPTHRRLGAASQLVKWGLALADAHQLPTYVESTPGGLSLYLKHGFEKVDTMEIDLRPWGRDHVQEHTILIRSAKQPAIPADQTTITPFLTNADFISFKEIEHAAYRPEIEKIPGSLPSPEPSKKPYSFFTLLARNIHESVLLDNSITDPTCHYIKAIQPGTNTIIGWALWNICSTTSRRPQSILTPKSAADGGLVNAFYSNLHKAENEYLKGKPYILMHKLAVLPEWQGKGVGKRLLGWGLEKADKHGLDCWVGVSEAALGLFEKLGWEQVGFAEVNVANWGGEEAKKKRVVQCIRKPKGRV